VHRKYRQPTSRTSSTRRGWLITQAMPPSIWIATMSFRNWRIRSLESYCNSIKKNYPGASDALLQRWMDSLRREKGPLSTTVRERVSTTTSSGWPGGSRSVYWNGFARALQQQTDTRYTPRIAFCRDARCGRVARQSRMAGAIPRCH